MSEELRLDSRCLAYHGPLLYEARIIKLHEPNKPNVEVSKGPNQTVEEANVPEFLRDQYGYYIHYKGWKATWDEWVGEARVLIFNEANVKLQKELKAAALKTTQVAASSAEEKDKQKQKAASASASASAPHGRKRTADVENGDSNSHAQGGKKSKRHNSLETEDEFLKRPEISIHIPDNLKGLLVDDWEHVTKDNQLVALPAKIPASEILARYARHKSNKANKGSSNGDILEEIISGLRLYFNRSLSSILLYKFERQQYMDVMALEQNEDKDPVEIYGAEHLLRLFVSLPGLVAQTSMDQQSIAVLKDFLEDIMRYMDARQDEIFLKKYENTTPAYESAAKN